MARREATALVLGTAAILGGCDGSRTSASTPTAPAASPPAASPPAPSASTAAPPAPPPGPSASAAPRVAGAAVPGPAASAAVPPAHTWGFDGHAPGAAPQGFVLARTGGGRQGRWQVQPDPGAPSAPHVLAQLDADATSYRFPVAVAEQPQLGDARVSVRCKMVSGKVDQACGLVARYRDENNYFITRANVLENNIRLYAVQGGERRQLASFDGSVTGNVWHDYRLELRGDHLQVFWDGQKVLEHHDATFGEAGLVGVWTKADSVTYFDDLRVEPL